MILSHMEVTLLAEGQMGLLSVKPVKLKASFCGLDSIVSKMNVEVVCVDRRLHISPPSTVRATFRLWFWQQYLLISLCSTRVKEAKCLFAFCACSACMITPCRCLCTHVSCPHEIGGYKCPVHMFPIKALHSFLAEATNIKPSED